MKIYSLLTSSLYIISLIKTSMGHNSESMETPVPLSAISELPDPKNIPISEYELVKKIFHTDKYDNRCLTALSTYLNEELWEGCRVKFTPDENKLEECQRKISQYKGLEADCWKTNDWQSAEPLYNFKSKGASLLEDISIELCDISLDLYIKINLHLINIIDRSPNFRRFLDSADACKYEDALEYLKSTFSENKGIFIKSDILKRCSSKTLEDKLEKHCLKQHKPTTRTVTELSATSQSMAAATLPKTTTTFIQPKNITSSHIERIPTQSDNNSMPTTVPPQKEKDNHSKLWFLSGFFVLPPMAGVVFLVKCQKPRKGHYNLDSASDIDEKNSGLASLEC